MNPPARGQAERRCGLALLVVVGVLGPLAVPAAAFTYTSLSCTCLDGATGAVLAEYVYFQGTMHAPNLPGIGMAGDSACFPDRDCRILCVR
jgi:hypothetical protein